METVLKTEIGGKLLTLESGTVAKQASGSVVVRYDDSVVLVTVVSDRKEREVDFLPLTVPDSSVSSLPPISVLSTVSIFFLLNRRSL